MGNNWQLKEHDEVERPYWEITNGPISLCVDDEDIEDKDIVAMQLIVNALNSGSIKFRSENALELNQHIEIMRLQSKLDVAKRDFERVQKSAIHYANRKDEVEKQRDKVQQERDQLKQQAQRMADALEQIAKEANNSPEDTWGEIAVRMKRIAIMQLQQFKDGKGKEVVCSCSLQQLAAHGECYKCPGQHTRHEITNPTK